MRKTQIQRDGFKTWLNMGRVMTPEKPVEAKAYLPKILDMVHVRPCLLFPKGDDAQVIAFDYEDTGGFKSLVFLCYTSDGSVVRVRPDEVSGPAEKQIVPFLVKSIR